MFRIFAAISGSLSAAKARVEPGAANAARARLAVSIVRWPTNRFTASDKPHAFKSLLGQPGFW
jgi:hypothetical protein